MPVGRPRVRRRDAGDEVAALLARGHPQPEGAVDMEPGVRLADDLDDLHEGIVGARVHLARLCADDRRSFDLGERGTQPVGPHPAMRVRRDDDELRAADPEEPERTVDGDVPKGADDDRDRGEPASPPSRTSHPRCASTWCRAAASAVTCAIWQPVVMANDASAGRPKMSFIQSPTISSTTDADGPRTPSAAHWSQIVVSQSAAIVAGSALPVT